MAPIESPSPGLRQLIAVPGARWAVAVAGLAWILVLVRLAFFAMAQPIWSPIDEFDHFFYVNHLNYSHVPPRIGLIFETTTDPLAPPALSIVPSRGRGVGMTSRHMSSEGIQPPGYYALMVPAFRTAAHGTYEQVTHVRLATAALAAFLIPITFLLALLVAPDRPWVWGAASLLPLLSRGYSYNLSQVTNDSLALLVGAAAVLVFLWLARSRLGWAWGLAAGLTAGLAILTKSTIYFVPLLFAALFFWRVVRERSWLSGAVAAIIGLLGAAALAVPWLVSNLNRYHSLSPPLPKPAHALAPFYNLPLAQALTALGQVGERKFWNGEGMVPAPKLQGLLTVGDIGLIACIAAFAIMAGRRLVSRDQLLLLGWAAVSAIYAVVLVLSTHVALLNGRYIYPLFPALAVLAALGADRLGRAGRWLFAGSAAAIAVVAALGMRLELLWVTGAPVPPAG